MTVSFANACLRERWTAYREWAAAKGTIKALSEAEAEAADGLWVSVARDEQIPPPARDDWTTWLCLGGRGSGKTRAGAQWVLFMAEHVGRIALVGETHGDVRAVMVEGESGLLKLAASDRRPGWHATRGRLEWPNGAIAEGFSSEDPEGLRGPQFAAAWCDEAGKWAHAEETWDMLQFGLRLGARPRQVVTTTPRTTPLMRRLAGDGRTVVSRMRTSDNERNLSPAFMKTVVSRYEGTRLGRQELDGEFVENDGTALWQARALDAARVREAPPLRRVVVGVDPCVSSGEDADACGIVVAGLGEDGRGYVLADRTPARATPAGWAAIVAATAAQFEADRVVAEVNQGGDLVEEVLRGAGHALPIRKVRASRGKWLRAEPVAALYEQGRVSHLPGLERLEDEMCLFEPNGRAGGRSPDRLDALVWALTDLMLRDRSAPHVRVL